MAAAVDRSFVEHLRHLTVALFIPHRLASADAPVMMLPGPGRQMSRDQRQGGDR